MVKRNYIRGPNYPPPLNWALEHREMALFVFLVKIFLKDQKTFKIFPFLISKISFSEFPPELLGPVISVLGHTYLV